MKTYLQCSVLAMLILTGCSQQKEMPGPMRAVWVTRYDYKTPDDVKRIIRNCDDAGFDTILFQVRGNGTVFYPSQIEPWAEQFDFKDPGFDPLQLAIDEAKSRQVSLHAWVNVMPAWRGPKEPAIKEQLYNAHPDWFWYDPDGNRQPLVHTVGDQTRGWYVSLNPCLPEVRSYLTDLFHELVSNYDVDGLHLDYIRFPNEPVVSGEVVPDYPRDERTLALYKTATGASPEDDEDAWNKWRNECVSALVGDIHRMMDETKPEMVLSAAVGCVPEKALEHHQDTRTWIDRGNVDAVMLMNYCSTNGMFEERNEPWLKYQDQVRLVPGLWITESKGGAEGAELSWVMIQSALNSTNSYCFFAYASLFDTKENVSPVTEADRKRAERREVLLPKLKSVEDRYRVK